jgi:hypothetical protein
MESSGATPRDSAHLSARGSFSDRILPNREKWGHLVPVIVTLSLGSLFVPNFALGTASGAALTAAAFVTQKTLRALHILKSKDDSASPLLQVSPLLRSLVLPVASELFLRGAAQPWIARGIVRIAPAAAATFLGTPLSIATGVSIVAIAVIAGLNHLFAIHKRVCLSAVACSFLETTSEIAFGVLAAQFGVSASLAAKIVYRSMLQAMMSSKNRLSVRP